MLPEIKLGSNFATNYRSIALSTTGLIVKANQTEVHSITLANTDASDAAFLKIYNKATAPTGSDTPIRTERVAANSTVVMPFNDPLYLGVGCSIRATKLLADNDATAPSSAIVVNIQYK
jgi:hypothetical protein